MIINTRTIKKLQFWNISKGGIPWWINRKRKKVKDFEITNYKQRVQKVKEMEELILKFKKLQDTPLEIEGNKIIDGDHRLTAISNLLKEGKIKSIELKEKLL